MATSSEIKMAIKKRINDSKVVEYSKWTIGITTELTTRKEAHGNPTYWQFWEADSLAIAREVEKFFLNEFPEQESKRMKGGTGGDMSPNKRVYVYIF